MNNRINMRIDWLIIVMPWLALGLMLTALESMATGQSNTAYGWLQKMHIAHQQLTYQGIFVRGIPTNLVSYQTTYSSADSIERELVEKLDGPFQQVLRTGDEVVYQTLEKSNIQNADFQRSPLFSDKIAGFFGASKYFNLSLVEGGRIAGFDTIKVIMQPQTPNRYGYQLWIAKRHHLLMKFVMVSKQDQVLELVQFSQMKVNPDLEVGWFDAGSTHIDRLSVSELELRTLHKKPQTKHNWRLDWLPEGFRRVKEAYEMPNAQDNAMIYTDGLVMFSVYLDQIDDMPTGVVSQKQMGSTTALMMNQQLNGKTYLVTVIGEIPIVAASKIAMSIKLKKS